MQIIALVEMSANHDDQVLATFAKKLTSNDPSVRSRNLKKLRNLLRKLAGNFIEFGKDLHFLGLETRLYKLKKVRIS